MILNKCGAARRTDVCRAHSASKSSIHVRASVRADVLVRMHDGVKEWRRNRVGTVVPAVCSDMGNNSSRKNQRTPAQAGQAARTLNEIEKLRGPSVDSYDKLIAWLAEMAENDNVQLDTSSFVRQLSKVCNDSKHNAKGQPIRQNSTSCESHASSGSQRCTKSIRSADDSASFDPRSMFRQAMSSRQGTFSDELEEERDDLKNASMESLYSGSDRDSELENVSVYDAKNGNNGGFKAFLRKPKQFAYSSSLGELDHIENSPIENQALLNSRRKSVSLLNLCPPEKSRGNGYEYVDNQPDDEPEVPSPENGNSFLNDKLLDGNIADILFSVEALWGK